MPAAVAIPALIGAAGVGANLYGAKKGADAAKSASSQQQQSVNRAQDFTEKAWDAQQVALHPYQQAGQYSLAALMARLYGGSPESYMPPQGYGQPPRPQMPQGMPMQPNPGQFTGQGGQGQPLGAPPFSLAAFQNRGLANMNAGQVGINNVPPAARREAGYY